MIFLIFETKNCKKGPQAKHSLGVCAFDIGVLHTAI